VIRLSELERQLVNAARRRARRHPVRRGARAVGLAFAGAVLLATGAVAAGVDLLPANNDTADPVGTKVRVPRERQSDGLRYTADRTIVATGTAPVLGPWEMSITDSDVGSCLGLQFLDQPGEGIGEGCGPTSDFAVGSSGNDKERLIHGQAPEEAVQVRITAADDFQRTVDTFDGPAGVNANFFALAVPSSKLRDARIVWLDRNGKLRDAQRVPGSA
jgi:hypothetical protein